MKKIFIIVFFLFLCSQPGQAADLKNTLARAEQYYDDGLYEKALSLINEVYDDNDDNQEINYLAGKCSFALKKFHWARNYFKKARSSSRVIPDIDLYLFRTAYETGDLSEAEDYLENIQKNNLDDAYFYFQFAFLLESAERYDQAVSVYKKSIEKNNKLKEPFYHLSLIYFQKKDYSSALEYAAKAYQLDPQDEMIKNNYQVIFQTAKWQEGRQYIKNKQYTEALPVFEELYKRDNNNYETVITLANVYYLLEEYPKAVKLLLNSEKIKPDPIELYKLLGMIYQKMERTDLALDYFQKALQISPKESDIYFKIAQVHEKNGSQANAEKYYKKSIHYNRNNGQVHFYFGLLLIKSWKYKEALAEMEKCRELGYKENDPEKYIQSLRLLTVLEEADNYYSQSKYNEAAEKYKQALQIEPLPKIYLNIGNAYIQLKKQD